VVLAALETTSVFASSRLQVGAVVGFVTFFRDGVEGDGTY
jgi:hypothetical protein